MFLSVEPRVRPGAALLVFALSVERAELLAVTLTLECWLH